jgi:hypothetical protein
MPEKSSQNLCLAGSITFIGWPHKMLDPILAPYRLLSDVIGTPDGGEIADNRCSLLRMFGERPCRRAAE